MVAGSWMLVLRLTSGNENRTNGAQHESLGGGDSAENGGQMEKLSARRKSMSAGVVVREVGDSAFFWRAGGPLPLG